jgi:hypothetical protein
VRQFAFVTSWAEDERAQPSCGETCAAAWVDAAVTPSGAAVIEKMSMIPSVEPVDGPTAEGPDPGRTEGTGPLGHDVVQQAPRTFGSRHPLLKSPSEIESPLVVSVKVTLL